MADAVTPDDLRRVLALVSEYTAKLRDISDRYDAARYRRLLMAVLTTISVAAFALFGLLYIPIWTGRPPLDALVYVVPPTAIILTAFYFAVVIAPLSKTIYDADELATIVERLIRTTSQYGEHAASKISDQFEYDLRLAEAEAALRTYQDVFQEQILRRKK